MTDTIATHDGGMIHVDPVYTEIQVHFADGHEEPLELPEDADGVSFHVLSIERARILHDAGTMVGLVYVVRAPPGDGLPALLPVQLASAARRRHALSAPKAKPRMMKPDPTVLDVTPRWWAYFGASFFEDVGLIASWLEGAVHGSEIPGLTKELRFGMQKVEIVIAVPTTLDEAAIEQARRWIVASLDDLANHVPRLAEAMRSRTELAAEREAEAPVQALRALVIDEESVKPLSVEAGLRVAPPGHAASDEDPVTAREPHLVKVPPLLQRLREGDAPPAMMTEGGAYYPQSTGELTLGGRPRSGMAPPDGGLAPPPADPAAWVVKTPDTCGGAARIVGTRIPVRTLVACRARGWSDAFILENYPSLSHEQLAGAWAYAAAHPEEMAEEGAFAVVDGDPLITFKVPETLAGTRDLTFTFEREHFAAFRDLFAAALASADGTAEIESPIPGFQRIRVEPRASKPTL